jgi:hypothetical protein
MVNLKITSKTMAQSDNLGLVRIVFFLDFVLEKIGVNSQISGQKQF